MLFPQNYCDCWYLLWASRIRKHHYKTIIILTEPKFNVLKTGALLNYIQGSIFYLKERLAEVHYKDQAITVYHNTV
jgi:hypothetical protein